MCRYNFLLIFLVFSIGSFAYSANWTKPAKSDMGVKLGIAVPSLGMTLQPQTQSNSDKVEYSPNTPSSTFLSLAYQNVGLGISMTNPINDELLAEKGKTKRSDYQFRFYGKKITTELFYQKYQGYYINNSSDVDPTYSGSSSKILRPDLKTEHWGIQSIYLFQPDNFSLGAAFDHFYRQTSSCASWLSFFYADHHKMKADSTWVPTQVTSKYPETSDLYEGLVVSYGLGLGFGGSLTAGGFYMSGIFGIGVGPQQQEFIGTQNTHKKTASASKGLARLGLGYNGSDNYAGVQILIESNNYEIVKPEGVSLSTVEGTFFYGHRFSGVSIPPLEAISDLID